MDVVDDFLPGAPGNALEAEAPLPVPGVPPADKAGGAVHLGTVLRLEVVRPPGIIDGCKELISMARSRSSTSSTASNTMDRGNKGKTDLFNFIPHPPSRMDACAYLEEPITMTFGEFRFGVNKDGSYRLKVPISSEFSAVDSNFSSSDEEFSSPYFIDSKASGKLAKIFSNTSFESSADSFISSDSESVDSFNFIDKSVAIGRLKEEDEAKTAFITPYGVFCYKTMPFGLKNAGATYQRMMQKCLATQIGKNVQVYIDDVVITSKKWSTLIEDLKETFDNLDKFCLKLNPTKCSFGVPAGELLGF
ncbi:hypothetical protein QYE76_012251 [Lolium multiflorum]|uniref:Reverse transcriptase domain-containing protein n=1 Tax=Lolium multiflorum TaxID=4521 RepID=A0AAD8X6G8_LOLMU|nr:hypothetical protein QYE76_012251 [Lolium multiflorum]